MIVNIEIKNINILVGPNGSGKSKFIEFFRGPDLMFSDEDILVINSIIKFAYPKLDWDNPHDGAKSFINSVYELFRPMPCLDNPEHGLDMNAISLLAELIHSQSKNRKIIIATHSPVLLDFFNIEDVILVNNFTFKRLNPSDYDVWTESYSLGELWIRNILQ